MTRTTVVALLVAVLIAAQAVLADGLPEVLERHLDAFVSARTSAWDTPGLSLAIVQGGTAPVTRGYGFADRGAERPMTDDTLVVLGSTTKAFTAPAVMQLVERGLIDLDASVTRYLPWFSTPEGRQDQITIRHLVSHTAGYPWGSYSTTAPTPERHDVPPAQRDRASRWAGARVSSGGPGVRGSARGHRPPRAHGAVVRVPERVRYRARGDG